MKDSAILLSIFLFFILQGIFISSALQDGLISSSFTAQNFTNELDETQLNATTEKPTIFSAVKVGDLLGMTFQVMFLGVSSRADMPEVVLDALQWINWILVISFLIIVYKLLRGIGS